VFEIDFCALSTLPPSISFLPEVGQLIDIDIDIAIFKNPKATAALYLEKQKNVDYR